MDDFSEYNQIQIHHANQHKTTFTTKLSKRSTFWHFPPESNNINLGEITHFCCLNCIFECINGFNVLENLWGAQIIHIQPLKFTIIIIYDRISDKIDQKLCLGKRQNIERLDYVLSPHLWEPSPISLCPSILKISELPSSMPMLCLSSLDCRLFFNDCLEIQFWFLQWDTSLFLVFVDSCN
jgi:hypothetical protein